MKTISIVNQKGGCGKTITAVNLAAALSKKGFKTLLIDLDPQAHATFALRKESIFSITDILEKVWRGESLGDEIYLSVYENFYFIPSRIGLASLEHKFAQRDDRLDILSAFLKQVWDSFDYCILDCPPNLGIITLNALQASNYSIIPLSNCDFSLRGIEILKNIIIMLKEFKGKSPTPFYILNQVDKRYRFSLEFENKVRNQLGNMLLSSNIRTNVYLKEAASSGKTIFEYRPNSRGAQDFMSLADEVSRITSQANWATLFLKEEKSSNVYVVGDFNNWQKEEKYKLNKVGKDIWSINIPLGKGTYRYKFVAGDTWISDPHNKLAEDDSFGGKNSLIFVE
ncbi:MAG: AAA family ATPase [Candidatus Omnitrophota bacterium]|nr:AAA family ATPase [Candidatus Omnitrophota bacterium]